MKRSPVPDHRTGHQPARTGPRAPRTEPSSLRPVRDTGMNVRSTRRRGRKSGPSPYSLLIAFSIITIVVMLSLIGRTDSHDEVSLPWATAAPEDVSAATAPEREPTPRFAEYDDLQLRLPVDPSDLTAVAFHQASGKLAMHMVSLAPDADMERAAELKAVPALEDTPTPAFEEGGGAATWTGCVLRLWRSNRSGAPDTAVDCGADPGSPVWAPISGTVVQVKA